MTALRGWGLLLGLSLCGCGARTADSAQAVRAQSAAPQPESDPQTASAPSSSAPQVAPAPAPTGFIKASTEPAPSGCCPPPAPEEVQQEAPPSPPTPNDLPPTEPPRPDAGAAPPPASSACFEYLGDWITCENAGWPHVEQTSAPDLQSCMHLCQQRPDCTAVTDYFWMDRPDLGCWLYTSTCSAPAGGVWQEEDGGRQYRKRCATQ